MRVGVFLLLAPVLAVAVDHANWMRDLMPVIGNATLLDLTLPGTHDTMTYDLAPVVSDGANDIPASLADLMHDFGDFLDIGDYIRNQVWRGYPERLKPCT